MNNVRFEMCYGMFIRTKSAFAFYTFLLRHLCKSKMTRMDLKWFSASED